MSTSAKPEKSKPERERQDWVIVLLILLIGFGCVIFAGQWALRFAPNWQVDTDMESNIDLNNQILTGKPQDFFEPLDPAILTQPGWVNVFLTPGAKFATGTPLSVSTTGTDIPTAIGTTAVPTNTIVVTNTAAPTNTLVWIPLPATRTSKPGGPANTATNTSHAPLPSADLGITQTEVPPTNTYVPGGVLTYTVTVTNAGPSNVNGVTIADTFTAQVVGASWSCVAVGTSCGAGGPGAINDVVNLPMGATVMYTINVNIAAGASGGLTHTAFFTMPGGYNETGPLPNIATDTNTRALSANLSVSIDDGTTAYVAGDTRTYTITVSNAAASDNVIGATVTDSFPVQFSVDSGSCTSAGGAVCGTWPGTGDINDIVDLPAGSSLTYTVNVTTLGGGDIVHEVRVDLPAGYLGPSPIIVDDTDEEIITVPAPWQIGSSPDYNIYDVPIGSSLTLDINLTADGNTADWELVYYELLNTVPSDFVLVDWVIIEISDGDNWYTIFNWGNGASDGNTNVASFSPEIDQLQIDIPSAPPLYNNTGIAIDIDSRVPTGPYYYIRFTSPSSGVGPPADGSTDIDAIQILP